MTVKVVEEDVSCSLSNAQEHCCLCRCETRYWYTRGDVALCPSCASEPKLLTGMVPNKETWWQTEQLIYDCQNREINVAAMMEAIETGKITGIEYILTRTEPGRFKVPAITRFVSWILSWSREQRMEFRKSTKVPDVKFAARL